MLFGFIFKISPIRVRYPPLRNVVKCNGSRRIYREVEKLVSSLNIVLRGHLSSTGCPPFHDNDPSSPGLK